MDVISTIAGAAKAAHVSAILLIAICTHESGGFTNNYNPNDNGTPSIGSCQVKQKTAEFLGWKGSSKGLMNPRTNAKYAALYLQYQQKRYGNDWVKLAASYNSGSYNESHKVLGCPRNLKYVRLVQEKLPEGYRDRLNCGDDEVAGNP